MIDKGAATVSDWLCYVYNTLENRFYHNIGDIDDTVEFPQATMDSLLPDTTILPEKYRFMIRMFYRLIHHPIDDKEYKLEEFLSDNVFNNPGFMILGHKDRMFSIPMSEKEIRSNLRDSILIYYLQLPIVAVSYRQVQSYLKWRFKIESQSKQVKKLRSKGYFLVRTRMLTHNEWIKYSVEFGPHKKGNRTSTIDTIDNDSCKCYLLNIRGGYSGKMYGAGAVPVFSYWADSVGLFCMYGNVAEMTEQKGIAVGASYNDYGKDCKADRIIPYSSVQPWLGFRCVLEFAKKKP